MDKQRKDVMNKDSRHDTEDVLEFVQAIKRREKHLADIRRRLRGLEEIVEMLDDDAFASDIKAYIHSSFFNDTERDLLKEWAAQPYLNTLPFFRNLILIYQAWEKSQLDSIISLRVQVKDIVDKGYCMTDLGLEDEGTK